MKYIKFKGTMGLPSIMIFPRMENHREVAENFHVLDKILSAGFFKIVDGKPVCYGKSVSLDTPSEEEDSKLMEFFLKDQW